LFKKYGAMYGFDWMLLAAVAYQESGLNPLRRSPAGAVGMMQVMPATAKSPRIGIDNPHWLENNVHAGAKYLALLRDTYFSHPDISSQERIYFVLAAYNAGPEKIRQARSLARGMGYDPDRWFRHTELAVLKLIGQETVRYVSNVNKYYLAYSLSSTLDCLKNRAPFFK
jgi:membrane-bound lytic murein transglycosylase MltF